MIPRIRSLLNQFTAIQLLWVTLAFIAAYIFFFAFFFPVSHRYGRLAETGAHTSGTVIAKEPKNHMSIRYAYTVAGARYEAVMSEFWLDPPRLDNFRIGQPVSVTFLPEQPWVSVPADPYKVYAYWRSLLIGVPLVFGVFFAVGVALRLNPAALSRITAYLTNRSS